MSAFVEERVLEVNGSEMGERREAEAPPVWQKGFDQLETAVQDPRFLADLQAQRQLRVGRGEVSAAEVWIKRDGADRVERHLRRYNEGSIIDVAVISPVDAAQAAELEERERNTAFANHRDIGLTQLRMRFLNALSTTNLGSEEDVVSIEAYDARGATRRYLGIDIADQGRQVYVWTPGMETPETLSDFEQSHGPEGVDAAQGLLELAMERSQTFS